jgi:hypothetical protein
MVLAGHEVGLPWACHAMSWLDRGLGWPKSGWLWSGLAMTWCGYWLVWPCAGLAAGLFDHGLLCP